MFLIEKLNANVEQKNFIVCICKKCAREKNENIINKISVNNEIDKSEEDL